MATVSTTRKGSGEKTGLLLSGGGARGAYQVGVLKAIAEFFPKNSKNPFAIINGTSAGAINAVALAASANNFRLAVKKVEKIWASLTVDQIYKAGWSDLLTSVGRLAWSMLHTGVGRGEPLALLNNAPLGKLLAASINFRNIQHRIDSGYLDAVGVTASCYASGESVTFFQGRDDIDPWRRWQRIGVPARLAPHHLMASSAIPTILPASKIGDDYFGDGALRQVTPISPTLHLGATRVLVIGVSGNTRLARHHQHESHSPSLAKMMGHVFNSAFIDSLDTDIEQLLRINELIGIIENENPGAPTAGMRKIDLLCIYPSIEFDQIAARHTDDLPWSMRGLLNVIGATQRGGGTSMASFLLFDSAFCRELIECGYRDAMEEERLIRDFFAPRRG